MTTRDGELLTTDEAAIVLAVPARTLVYWRRRSTGPSYLRLGHRTIRYRRDDLLAWANMLAVTSPDELAS